MSSDVLERRFGAIGARLRVTGDRLGAPRIDIASDRRGELFDLTFTGVGAPADVDVVDVAPAERHLLLLVREGETKSKFLCGHDERHWFVAAVPEAERGVRGVATAMAALQPEPVRDAAAAVRRKDRFRRRNAAYLRQGEWYFVPAPGLRADGALVLRDEPLSRGEGSKPHVLSEAFRRGGQTVYVRGGWAKPLTEAEHAALPRNKRDAPGWRLMTRDPELYARGTVRHSDHATIELRGWHRVLMNTEGRANAMRHVAFLD